MEFLMKTGILSMQRVINYGSFLQAYALKRTIEGFNNMCDFINIVPGKQINLPPKINTVQKIINVKGHFLLKLKYKKYVNTRNTRFINAFFPILGIEKEETKNNNRYDAVVIGSDEVFNGTQQCTWGFTEQLYGKGLNAPLVISYAGSFGATTLEKIQHYHIEKPIGENLKNLKAVSVRDQNSADIVKTLCGFEPEQHIDPTLIYDFTELEPQKINDENYILIYGYDNRIKERDIIQKVKKIARKEKLTIISAGVWQDWCDKNILVTPFELLAYFRNAKYVVTDTFHGTVFSIKQNRPFVTILRKDNTEKLYDLLRRFNLTDRSVVLDDDLYQKLNETINYEAVNKIIEKEKEKSIAYLRKYLT